MERFGVQSLDELKDRPAEEIYDAWLEAGATDGNLANNCAKPIVDGDWVPNYFSALAVEGSIADVPCIIGMSSDDMWPFYLYSFAVGVGRISHPGGQKAGIRLLSRPAAPWRRWRGSVPRLRPVVRLRHTGPKLAPL